MYALGDGARRLAVANLRQRALLRAPPHQRQVRQVAIITVIIGRHAGVEPGVGGEECTKFGGGPVVGIRQPIQVVGQVGVEVAIVGRGVPPCTFFRRPVGIQEHVMGIPGTVGGAVVMNAGTKEGDISSLIASVEAVTPDRENLDLAPGDLDFGYRKSVFQGKGWLIIDVVFELRPVDTGEVIDDLERIWKERGDLYPMSLPNAGSVFRNPEGNHAGYLIEQAGLRGTRVGGAEVSEKHGNFIVNRGGATSSDIVALIELIRGKIREKYGIDLALEQKILPSRPGQ